MDADPSNMEVKIGLAQIKIEQSNMKEAKDLINSAMSLSNEEIPPLLRYLKAYVLAESQEHNYSEAIAELDLIPESMQTTKYLTLKAKCMVKNYDVQGGIAIAIGITNSEPDNVEALLALAEGYLYQDNLEEANAQVVKAEFAADKNDVPEASLLKAKIAERREEYEEAERLYNEYIMKLPNQSRPYFEYGRFLKLRNRNQEAVDTYKNIIKMFPGTEVADNAQLEISSMN